MDTKKEKISRFASGKFSFNDYLSVNSFFQKEEHNNDLEKIMEDEWAATQNAGDDKERLSKILNRLHLHINQNTGKQAHPFEFYRLFSKLAAVLLIPALITIAVLSYIAVNPSSSDSWVQIYSPVGARTKFQLPDGTQGWLNGGSSIKYPVSFINNRSVGISGEAWFDVVHHGSEEFRVSTPYFDVMVLGTQFNVVAYDDETTAEVVLERGKVLVLGKDKELEMIPDQHVVFNKSTKEFTKTGIDSKTYTSWKDGWLIFKNVPMAEIAKRLERRYNTEIILHGDSLKTSIFRATFQDESLEDICRMLATVAPVRYKMNKREVQPDGTFAKGKVEMWLIDNMNKKK
ncbi:MAG: FecR domain-containing protein [Mariniphaga sp.]